MGRVAPAAPLRLPAGPAAPRPPRWQRARSRSHRPRAGRPVCMPQPGGVWLRSGRRVRVRAGRPRVQPPSSCALPSAFARPPACSRRLWKQHAPPRRLLVAWMGARMRLWHREAGRLDGLPPGLGATRAADAACTLWHAAGERGPGRRSGRARALLQAGSWTTEVKGGTYTVGG